MSAAPLDIADYLTSDPVIGRADGVALALPMLHHEILDEASASWSRDWRAEIRMTDMNAGPSASRVTVGAVDFVIVQPSEAAPNRPIAEHLSMLGPRTARFGELFVGGRLEPVQAATTTESASPAVTPPWRRCAASNAAWPARCMPA